MAGSPSDRRPGRPSTGTPVHIRLPDELLARIDRWADEQGLTRAEAIRRLLSRVRI
jgi:metal-responsive CopG/Arc/MetJ family transcriptional regulator